MEASDCVCEYVYHAIEQLVQTLLSLQTNTSTSLNLSQATDSGITQTALPSSTSGLMPANSFENFVLIMVVMALLAYLLKKMPQRAKGSTLNKKK